MIRSRTATDEYREGFDRVFRDNACPKGGLHTASVSLGVTSAAFRCTKCREIIYINPEKDAKAQAASA